ncbi:MgtC/SapB family protein [Roseomonas hellenica]|uniref:Protein MgtC n=1 Tax=Plastoroseomonas hellenica TaxID=2687306 RepID=A0ABS5F1V7_9PROT|nr:MgtC/SapB family protein [Plastoroseomonas hellenica]
MGGRVDSVVDPHAISDLGIFLRLGTAALLGMALGLDREMRGLAAGIRTHGLIALSAAAVMVSGLLLYAAVRTGHGDADPLRVAQGIFQAIGFIGAGLVFARHGDVHNVTSAASITLATAIGIAAGAGQYKLTAIATGLGILMLSVVRVMERLIPGSSKTRKE